MQGPTGPLTGVPEADANLYPELSEIAARGPITLALACVAGILLVMAMRRGGVALPALACALGAVALVVALVGLADVRSAEGPFAGVNVGWGIVTAIAGAILLGAGAGLAALFARRSR